MLTIEGRSSGGYEVIGENGNAVFRSDFLETAAIVRDYLANANMTDDERQTAKAAIRVYMKLFDCSMKNMNENGLNAGRRQKHGQRRRKQP